MKIAVIIINFNNYQLTRDCLQSLSEQILPHNIELLTIVVDNHSHDDSAERLAEEFPHIELIKSPVNVGFTGGNNLGVAHVRAQQVDFVLLLNNDTIVDKQLIKELLEGANRHPQAGIIAPKIYFASGYEFHKNRYTKNQQGKVIWFSGGSIDWQNMYGSNIGVDEVDVGQFDQENQIELASGCCMLIREPLFQNQPLFDDRYFMYYEDTELCIRAQKKGWQIWYIPTAKLWHINAGSSSSGSDLQDYFITRNRLLVGISYAPLKTKVALIREAFSLLLKGRKWQGRAVRDFFLQRFKAGSYPVKP